MTDWYNLVPPEARTVKPCADCKQNFYCINLNIKICRECSKKRLHNRIRRTLEIKTEAKTK